MSSPATSTVVPQPSGGVVGARFLERLVTKPRGRAFILNFLRSTEEADEGALFDMLVQRVEDPELQRMVKRHRDDERRHAEIFQRAAERVVALGDPEANPGPVPKELEVVGRLDQLLGGFAAGFLAGRVGVMEVYLILLALEERAVREWPAIAAALRPIDPESAADVDRVLRDEARHVRYARAISRRYAPDEATLERTLAHVRRAEQQAFDENTNAFTRIALERGLVDVGPVEHLFWRAATFLGDLRTARAASRVAA
jgi:rubrerythrin